MPGFSKSGLTSFRPVPVRFDPNRTKSFSSQKRLQEVTLPVLYWVNSKAPFQVQLKLRPAPKPCSEAFLRNIRFDLVAVLSKLLPKLTFRKILEPASSLFRRSVTTNPTISKSLS